MGTDEAGDPLAPCKRGRGVGCWVCVGACGAAQNQDDPTPVQT